MKYLFLLFSFSVFLSVAQNKSSHNTKSDSADIKRQWAENEKSKVETLNKLKSETDVQLPLLLEKFNLYMIPNTSSGWYHNKDVKDYSSPYIEAPVSVKGHIYLKAYFAGDTFMNITRIRVKIANASYECNPLRNTSKYITKKKAGSKSIEILHFFSYDNGKDKELRSINMISVIANANEEAKIIVEFIGENDNAEIVLTKDNIKAIRDSWHLSQYISYTKNNYTTYTVNLTPWFTTKPRTFLIPKDPYTLDDLKGIIH